MSQDRITDEMRVTLLTEAISHNAPRIYDAPRLVVRCGSEEGVEAYVHWGGQYVAGYDNKMEVAIRFDAHPAAFESWRESAGNEGAFMPFPITFIHRANRSKVVYVQMTDFSGDEFTAEFKLSGLADGMAAHSELCRMPKVEEWSLDTGKIQRRTFSAFPVEYEPLFGIGIPTLEFHCYQNEKDRIVLRIDTSGDLFGEGRISRRTTANIPFSGSVAQFDDGHHESLVWAPVHIGYELESSVSSVFNQTKDSAAIIISGTIGSGHEMRAEYDISDIGELIGTEPKCAN